MDVKRKRSRDIPRTSKRMLESFHVSEIPFLECNYDTLYQRLARIVPKDIVCFDYWDIETFIACETVCAAICHQMNWDYLRQAVFEKTVRDMEWISPGALAQIPEVDVYTLLSSYNRPERLRVSERASILRQVGECAMRSGGFVNLCFDEKGSVLPESELYHNFLMCRVFSSDPEKKKLQLLFQKLARHTQLAELEHFCKPAIDYHLIRCYLRRGLISPKNKLAMEFVQNSSGKRIERKESTVGALRQLCAILTERISDYTGLSINQVNQIEWHVGRSICTEGMPDCYLNNPNASWIKPEFDKCPFYQNCCAAKYNNELLYIEEPVYKGTSY